MNLTTNEIRNLLAEGTDKAFATIIDNMNTDYTPTTETRNAFTGKVVTRTTNGTTYLIK